MPPLNLLGDFGGGGMLLAFGVLAALLERQRSGAGQVVDAAMVDGAALLTALLTGCWRAARGDERGHEHARRRRAVLRHLRTADGGFVAVGALEPQFYAALLAGSASDADLPGQCDRAAGRRCGAGSPRLRAAHPGRVDRVSRARDACVAPVLAPAEAPAHPHNAARGTFVEVTGFASRRRRRGSAARRPRFPVRPATRNRSRRSSRPGGSEDLELWLVQCRMNPA